MNGPVSIDFELGEHGWASLRVTIGTESVEIGEFGYCTDALGDLGRAALMLVCSGYYAEVSFDGEPKEWRLLLGVDPDLGPLAKKSLPVRIKTFQDIGFRAPEAGGLMIFEAETTADDFGRAVEVAARSIWNLYGEEGYNKAWEPIHNAFPLRALNALSLALSMEEPVLRII